MSKKPNHTLLAASEIKETLRHYESLFPEEALRPLSFALVGQSDGCKLQFTDEKPVESTLENVLRALEEETPQRAKEEDNFTDEMVESLPQWEDLCYTLSTLTDRTGTIEYAFRQYDTDTSDETPAEINEQGKNGAFGLLSHANKITGVGSLIAYELQNGEYAVLLKREDRYGAFSTKISGQYYGSFEVTFTGDVEAYVKSELHPEGWYRPQDLNSSEPNSADPTSTTHSATAD